MGSLLCCELSDPTPNRWIHLSFVIRSVSNFTRPIKSHMFKVLPFFGGDMTNGVNLETGKGLPSNEVNLCTWNRNSYLIISTAIKNVTHFFPVWFNVSERNKKVTGRLQGWCPAPFTFMYQIDSHKRNKRTVDERQPVRRGVTSTSCLAYLASLAEGQHQQCCTRRPPRGMSTLCCSSPYAKQEIVKIDHRSVTSF